MIDVFFKTLPFFALVALGYGAARAQFFSPQGTAVLTKFVFYFALPAMIFKFSSGLSFADILDWPFIGAYVVAGGVIYALATAVAIARGVGMAQAAVEAQCAVIGNVGFLGIPMLALLMGAAAVPYIMIMLSVDLILFGSLIVVLILFSRDGRMSFTVLGTLGMGVLKNPMVVSIVLGLIWAATGWAVPAPAQDFIDMLGAAATPCALFVIGASLAGKSAERVSVAGWLSFCKLVLHPLAVGVAVFWLFRVDGYAAAVMIASASLPVAGNIYIVAQHYGVAPMRVSSAILVSTVASVVTVSVVIAWVARLY